MHPWQDFFRGKKITVMGIGLLGGVLDIRFLAEQGVDLIVTDLKSEVQAAPSLKALKDFPAIRYTIGRHELSDFSGRDLIVMAPGVRPDSPYIAQARKEGTPITMWAALFSRFAREIEAPIVGITGTRGKTTTTEMIAHGLRTAGKKVIAGGNIRGTAMLPYLTQLSPETFVVLELDSWKIQGFREERLSPDVGIFTTFYADHLDYYRGDPQNPRDLPEAMGLYLADKAEIFLHQGEHDTLVLGEEAAQIVLSAYEDRIKSHVVIARAADLPADWRLRVPGEHNRANAACALFALRALSIEDSEIRKALESFTGVKDRLEMVREIGGVKYYNDTTATTPEATIAALRALDPNSQKNIILIMGGSDKNLDMSKLLEEIPNHCKKIILLNGAGTVRILPSLTPYSALLTPSPSDSLGAAIAEARSNAQRGDCILMSPAFASFGMFKNEYDRGEQFRQLVRAL